jgi:hypothetical protein
MSLYIYYIYIILYIYLLVADQIKKIIGNAAAIAIEPTYAAPFAAPLLLFVFALGSTLIFKLSDVEVEVYEGISVTTGTLLVVIADRLPVCVVNAVVP